MDAADGGQRRAGRWAALSLERKLPVLIGGFLLATTAALSVAGYVAVRRNALSSGAERADVLTTQLRDRFVALGGQLRTLTRTVAARPEVAAYVQDPSASQRERVLQLFRQSSERTPTLIGVTLRSRDGTTTLSTVPEAYADTLGKLEQAIWTDGGSPPDSASIGRLVVFGDSLRLATLAPVAGKPDVLAILWWRLTMSAQNRAATADLLGSDARVLVGNVADDAWTDLERIVPKPERLSAAFGEPQAQEHDGERYVMRAAEVPGTPWATAVELPYDGVTEPAWQFARQVGAIAFLVIAIGLLLAWRVSRDITNPIADLTEAASSLAHGDYRAVPRVDRADEIGKLSHAFGKMATEVEHARTKLEAKVDERTRELNTAMVQLHDTQDALVRREKMATLGQLASGVGHELRNPLGVMTNAVYYLRAVLASQPENVREYLDILHQQIQLSEKIVADLLDFARSKPPHRVPSDLRRVVQAQIAQLVASGHTEVTVTEDFPADLPPVLIDASQAGQVVLNLFTNAAQAMDGRGTIAVRALRDVDRVHLEVMDTGPGVPPENIEKIFEPLFTTKARGIGLGLALSRTLARANGGDLGARNNAGRGATFDLTLPVAGGTT